MSVAGGCEEARRLNTPFAARFADQVPVTVDVVVCSKGPVAEGWPKNMAQLEQVKMLRAWRQSAVCAAGGPGGGGKGWRTCQ